MKKLVVAGVAVVLAGVLGVWVVLSGSDDITDVFDMDNARFYLQEAGMPVEEVSLTGGVYETDEMRIEVVEGPVYSDLDGDGQLDAAAILEQTGEEGWRGVFGWTWSDGDIQPVKWMFGWQYNCVVDQPYGRQLEDLSLATIVLHDDGTVHYGLLFGRHFENRCVNPNLGGGSSTPKVAAFLHEGVPVSTYWPARPDRPLKEPLSAVTTECVFAQSFDPTKKQFADVRSVDPSASLRLVPEDGAPEVTGPAEIELAYVWVPQEPDPELLELRNGYVPADIEWDDGARVVDPTCSWVKWDAVDPPPYKER